MSTTPKINIPLLEASQASKHITANEAFVDLDAMVSGVSTSTLLVSPPPNPTEGSGYLLLEDPSGDWVGKRYSFAYYYGGTWRFFSPYEGMQLYDLGIERDFRYLSGNWVSFATGGQGEKGDTGEAGADNFETFTEFLGSSYLLDPNEFCGWAEEGLIDQTQAVKLGSVGGEPIRASGGLVYPYDVRVKRLFVWHKNSNAGAEGWGWRISAQTKVAGSNDNTYFDIYRGCTGIGETAIAPNDYQNTVTQNTDIDLSGSQVIPAGTVVIFGVEAPTASNTNYYVDVMAGYLEIEKVV